MARRLRFAWTTWGFILLFVGSGCSRAAIVGAVPTADARSVIRIGLVGAAPGPGSLEGGYTGKAAELAVDSINHAGGIRWNGQPYQLALAFGNGDLANQVHGLVMSQPPIAALLGPDESDTAIATSPIAARAQVPQITLATGTDLTDPARNQHDLRLFRIRPPDSQWARSIAQYVTQTSGLAGRSVALATLANDYGERGAALILRTLASANMIPGVRVALAPGLPDPAAAAAPILAAHPDLTICWSTEPECALLLHALRAGGWPGQMVVGVLDDDLIALAGSDGEGLIGASNWTPSLPGAANMAFLAAYQQRYGDIPDAHAAAMYDAIGLLAAGIAAVGPDHAALAIYLAQVNGFMGVQGRYDAPQAMRMLGTQGDLTAQLAIIRVQQAHPTILALSGT